jgi:chaperonin GroEL (HSP60 family)
MLVDSMGDVVVTNDGVTILKEMDVEHPAAKMLVEVAKTQDQECGDGTTTAVILTGELLKRAEGLIDQNIHPTIISQGYRLASKKALEVLHQIAKPVHIEDHEQLKRIAVHRHGLQVGLVQPGAPRRDQRQGGHLRRREVRGGLPGRPRQHPADQEAGRLR